MDHPYESRGILGEKGIFLKFITLMNATLEKFSINCVAKS